MKPKHAAMHNDSPFSRWLLEQVQAHDTSLTELGQRAGLSSGTLRSIVAIPNRQPTLDTCLRLARALDIPYETILEIANLDPALPEDVQLPDPDRSELIRLYNALPSPAQRAAVEIVRMFSDYVSDHEPRQSAYSGG